MEILRKRRNFHKTKKQYENAFKSWGFRKYKMTPAKWKVISRKIKKRKRESGKDSDVYIDGERYPLSKVEAGISRHGFVSAVEMYSVPSPDMPDGIVVCTPTPVPVFQWPPSLPWLQFLRQVSKGSSISLSASSTAVLLMGRHEHPLATHDMISDLEAIMPHRGHNKTSNVDREAHLHNTLRVLMPEEKNDAHQITSEVLCGHMNDNVNSVPAWDGSLLRSRDLSELHSGCSRRAQMSTQEERLHLAEPPWKVLQSMVVLICCTFFSTMELWSKDVVEGSISELLSWLS